MVGDLAVLRFVPGPVCTDIFAHIQKSLTGQPRIIVVIVIYCGSLVLATLKNCFSLILNCYPWTKGVKSC